MTIRIERNQQDLGTFDQAEATDAIEAVLASVLLRLVSEQAAEAAATRALAA